MRCARDQVVDAELAMAMGSVRGLLALMVGEPESEECGRLGVSESVGEVGCGGSAPVLGEVSDVKQGLSLSRKEASRRCSSCANCPAWTSRLLPDARAPAVEARTGNGITGEQQRTVSGLPPSQSHAVIRMHRSRRSTALAGDNDELCESSERAMRRCRDHRRQRLSLWPAAAGTPS